MSLDNDNPVVQALQKRYAALCHAMQSGVTFTQDKTGQEPKHLRVGVNTSLVNSSALAALLMKKGLITPMEYWEALVEGMEAEVKDYEARLSSQFGKPVTLA